MRRMPQPNPRLLGAQVTVVHPGPTLGSHARQRFGAGPRRLLPANPASAKGTTLLEAMIVASLATIALAIGLPSYQGVIERQRVSSAMHLLTAHIASARNTAITYRIATVVCPSNRAGGCRSDGDWSQGWLMFFDPDGNRRPDLPDEVLRDENAPIHPTLRITSSIGRPQLRYLPDGRSAGSNISIRICRQDRVLGKVIVSNVGRPRTERPIGHEPC